MKNKKFNTILISSSLSVVLLSSITLVALNTIINNNYSPIEKKPLNRGSNYEHYKISSYFETNENIREILKSDFRNGKYIICINEDNFINFLKRNFINILRKIGKFKLNADEYETTFNYRLSRDNQSILIDVVWNLPNKKYYFYDQFELKAIN